MRETRTKCLITMTTFVEQKKEKAKKEKMINEKFTSLDIFVLFAVNFPCTQTHNVSSLARKLLGLQRLLQL